LRPAIISSCYKRRQGTERLVLSTKNPCVTTPPRMFPCLSLSTPHFHVHSYISRRVLASTANAELERNLCGCFRDWILHRVTESCAHGCFTVATIPFCTIPKVSRFCLLFFFRFYIQIRVILNLCSFYSRLHLHSQLTDSFLAFLSCILCTQSVF